jgi:hypothetical protein
LGVQSLLLAVLGAGVGEFSGRERYARWVGAAYAWGGLREGSCRTRIRATAGFGGVGDADTARDR